MRKVTFDNKKNIHVIVPAGYEFSFFCGNDKLELKRNTIRTSGPYLLNRSWPIRFSEDEASGNMNLKIETMNLSGNIQNLIIELSSEKALGKQAVLRYYARNDLIGKIISTDLEKINPYIEISMKGTIELGMKAVNDPEKDQEKDQAKETVPYVKPPISPSNNNSNIKELIVLKENEFKRQSEENERIKKDIDGIEAEYRQIEQQIIKAEKDMNTQAWSKSISEVEALDTDALRRKYKEVFNSLFMRLETDAEMAEDTLFAMHKVNNSRREKAVLLDEEKEVEEIKARIVRLKDEIMKEEQKGI